MIPSLPPRVACLFHIRIFIALTHTLAVIAIFQTSLVHSSFTTAVSFVDLSCPRPYLATGRSLRHTYRYRAGQEWWPSATHVTLVGACGGPGVPGVERGAGSGDDEETMDDDVPRGSEELEDEEEAIAEAEGIPFTISSIMPMQTRTLNAYLKSWKLTDNQVEVAKC